MKRKITLWIVAGLSLGVVGFYRMLAPAPSGTPVTFRLIGYTNITAGEGASAITIPAGLVEVSNRSAITVLFTAGFPDPSPAMTVVTQGSHGDFRMVNQMCAWWTNEARRTQVIEIRQATADTPWWTRIRYRHETAWMKLHRRLLRIPIPPVQRWLAAHGPSLALSTATFGPARTTEGRSTSSSETNVTAEIPARLAP